LEGNALRAQGAEPSGKPAISNSRFTIYKKKAAPWPPFSFP
jgi:hypothetical protein